MLCQTTLLDVHFSRFRGRLRSGSTVIILIFKSYNLLEIGQTLTWFFYLVCQHHMLITRELLELSEEDKLQAAMDVAEAVYFIHNLSNPVVHQVRSPLHRWMVDDG